MMQIQTTPNRGRGVFATSFIAKGTVLEDAPVIVVPPDQLASIKSTVLFEYFFRWRTQDGDGCAICLGFGSLYNHSSVYPNAHYVRLYTENKIRFFAVRDIMAGEEIFTNYHGDTDCRRPLWFEDQAHASEENSFGRAS